MIKKILMIIALLVPALLPAQVAVGGWKLYTPFIGVESMDETDTYVYYVSGGAVFRIDKGTTEVQSMNIASDLNDANAKNVYADSNRKSVIVTYASGNMDRIYDNGKIINLPDVKDALTVPSRSINDISFGADKFYVATDFGLITYSNSKNEVNETMFTDTAVKLVGASSALVAIYMNDFIYVAPASQRIKKLTDLTEINGEKPNVTSLATLGDEMIYYVGYNVLTRIQVDKNNLAESPTNNWFTIENYTANTIAEIYNSAVYKINDTEGYCYNKYGLFTFSTADRLEKTSMPEPKIGVIYLYDGSLASVWEGSTAGVCEMNYSGSTPQQLTGYISGSELNLSSVQNMTVGKSGRIYMNMIFQNNNLDFYDKTSNPARVIAFKDGEFEDVTGYDVEIVSPNDSYRNTPAPHATTRIFRVKEDFTDPDAYYIGTFFNGLYHIKNNKQLHNYYVNTAGFYFLENWACLIYDADVDNNGNLWTYAAAAGDDTTPRLFVLPAEKRNKAVTTPDDWRSFALKGVTFDNWESNVMACRHSDRVVVTHGAQSKYIFVVDTKGTASVADDVVHVVDREIDQDGKEWPKSWGFICIAEDNNGKIWVGTDVGLFEIPDIKSVNGTTANIRRMKIPRNDGTNLADYLLDNVKISAIAVDASNRKWISTIGSGVYLVSPDGDAILEHYTSDNSILPSNNVNSVVCDPYSNKVYFGTSSGLIEYSSTSAPGAESYDNVYAYPNPVRPDFGGWITVTGLMDNSLVKIADSFGNVVHQGKSDGGMFVWNGCNASGERVKSGIYYVLASQNATGKAEACVTKIMVIN